MQHSTALLKKSYDLRGIYPTQIDAPFFESIGHAFALWAPSGSVVIGWDARLSTPELKEAMIRWLISGGRNVIDLGLISSDMLQFASIHLAEEVALGIMITASHNPKEYNGFKCCLKNAAPIDLRVVGPILADTIERWVMYSGALGSYETYDPLPAWINKVASFVQSDMSHLRVVADAGNGTAGVFMGALAEKLWFELIPLFFEPDGNFPNHHPSPIEWKNMVDLQRSVIAEWADIGVAFDGDADRAIFCDKNGMIVSPSIALAAIAEYFLHLQPGGKILYNTPTSHIVRETILKSGGIPIQEKVGNVYIKAHMQSDPEIIFAGEHSSHYFFSSLGNLDSGLMAFVLFLEYMSQFELTAEEVRLKFSKYSAIEETNFVVPSVWDAITIFEDIYKDGIQEKSDGLTITYLEWWMSIRGSMNEPILRINIEANSAEILETKKNEVFQLIGALK